MKKVISILNTAVQYVFLMIILNMMIVLLSLISFGLLAPFAIYFAFIILNSFIRKERPSFSKLNLSYGGVITLICYLEVIIIYQYIKVLPYVAVLSFETLVYIAFGIICVYFYMFNTYFMFLATKKIKLKKILLLALIAPFHSIKILLLLIIMLVITVVFLLNFQSLLLLIGLTILLVLNNIILENYYVAIKE